MHQYLFNKKDILKFGKYKGKSIEEIDKSNPKYIEWCIDKDIISLDNELIKFHKKNMDKIKYSHYYPTDYLYS